MKFALVALLLILAGSTVPAQGLGTFVVGGMVSLLAGLLHGMWFKERGDD